MSEGQTQVKIEELLAAIGELYVQARVLRQMLQQQQQPQPANGVDRPQPIAQN